MKKSLFFLVLIGTTAYAAQTENTDNNFLKRFDEIHTTSNQNFSNTFYPHNPIAERLYNKMQYCWDKTIQLRDFLEDVEKQRDKPLTEEERAKQTVERNIISLTIQYYGEIASHLKKLIELSEKNHN